MISSLTKKLPVASPAPVAAAPKQTSAPAARLEARHVPVNLSSSSFSSAPAASRAPVALSADLSASSKKAAKMTTVYQDQFCKIVTDDPKMTKAQGQALAKKVEDAWQADLKLEQWKDTSPLNKNQLTVQALTKSGFDKALGGDSTGVAGVTMGPDLMAVPENLTSSTNPDDDDTIAHELNHVMDFREAGDGIDSIPVYEQEGKAYTVGDTYPITEGKDKSDPVLRGVGEELSKITGAQARDVMDNYRDGSAEGDSSRDGFRDETTGALYVQFLKTRLGGAGVPDALQRLAQVTADVGQGQSYDNAFQKEFGVSSKSTEDAFVKYVTATEGKPSERMAGTLWAPYMDLASSKLAQS